MKVVHVSTHDVRGGAARAMYRLHIGLRRSGVSSRVFVRDRDSDDSSVSAFVPPPALLHRILRRIRHIHNRVQLHSYAPHLAGELFSGDRWIYRSDAVSRLPDHDVVNLHWIARFIDYASFFKGLPPITPVVWTLHDMNAFTGGCHYDDGCDRYTHSCGSCPKLGAQSERDLSRKTWLRKRRILGRIRATRLCVVSPSQWLADRSKQSPLLGGFRVTVIPYGVDTEVYRPLDAEAIRTKFGIPSEARVVLWASDSRSNPRKGFDLLHRALRRLQADSRFHLLCVGRGGVPVPDEIPHTDLGTVGDEEMMAAVFSAADVHVVPSLLDNYPNTILESYACGTPVVGNRAAGIVEMVRSEKTGELVDCTDADALAAAIRRVGDGSQTLGAACREVAIRDYGLTVQAKSYSTLYEDMKLAVD